MELSRNEYKVLRAICLLDAPTRSSVSAFTGLGVASVSSPLGSLTKRGLLDRTSVVREGGGRPRHAYHVRRGAAYTVGVSLDPESSHVLVLDADRHIVSASPFTLTLSSPPENHVKDIVAQVHAQVRAASAGGPYRGLPPLAVGVTLEGLTDADRGIWVRGLQVNGVSLVHMRGLLELELELPTTIDDPARSLAYAEYLCGLGRGARTSLVIYLGSGVGSGVVTDSRLFHGSSGLAGEIGHLVVDPRGYRCRCGDVGCLETVASTNGILRLIRTRLEEGVASSLEPRAGTPREPSLRDVLEAARGGDRLARSVLYEVGELLGNACATAIKLLNPDRIIISGPGAMFAEFLEARVRTQIERHVVPEMLSGFSVQFATYEAHHEAWGAALLALERYWAVGMDDLAATSAKAATLPWRAPPPQEGPRPIDAASAMTRSDLP